MLFTIIITTTYIYIIHRVHLYIILFISKINNESKMSTSFVVMSISLSESHFPFARVQLGEHTGLWGKPNLALLVEYGKNPALKENETRTIARI